MSVHTPIDIQTMGVFLSQYPLGALDKIEPIQSPSTQTLYRAYIEDEIYLVTLYENASHADVTRHTRFVQHLSETELPLATPLTSLLGNTVQTLEDKACTVAPYLPGKNVRYATPEQCATIGAHLARLHISGKTYPDTIPNPKNKAWRTRLEKQLLPHLDKTQQQLLRQAQQQFQQIPWDTLPAGMCHGQLTRRHAVFQADSCTGLLGFEQAAVMTWLYDLCVALQDWCQTAAGTRCSDKSTQLIAAYEAIRPLKSVEKVCLARAAVHATTSTWLTSLAAQHLSEREHTKPEAQQLQQALAEQMT